jgi:hypothetical protein
MSGSADATLALKQAALENYRELRGCVTDLARAAASVESATDLVQAIQAVDAYAMANDALAKIATILKKQVDGALCRTMSETGATSLHSNGHVISVRKTPAPLDIPVESAVPTEFFTTPKPTLDRDLIRKHLKFAQPNWATLGEPGIGIQRKPLT